MRNFTHFLSSNCFLPSTFKRLMTFAFLSFVAVGSIVAQCSCPGNELTNSGFDSGNTNGWQSSTHFSSSTGHQQCGTARNGVLNATGGSGWFWQEVNATPGASYFMQAYAGTHQSSYDHRLRLGFYDASGNLITSDVEHVNHVTSGGSLQLYTLQGVAPSNSATVRVEGYASNDYLKVDQVCLTSNDISDFNYGCGSGTSVTMHPVDNNGEMNSSISIPNSNQVFEYVVEVVYKGSYNPGPGLTVTAGGSTYHLTRVVVDGSSSNEKVWRGKIVGNPSTISYAHPGGTGTVHQLQSMLVYAFRSNVGSGSSVSGEFTAPRNGNSNVGNPTEYRFVGDPNVLSPCCIEIIEVIAGALTVTTDCNPTCEEDLTCTPCTYNTTGR